MRKRGRFHERKSPQLVHTISFIKDFKEIKPRNFFSSDLAIKATACKIYVLISTLYILICFFSQFDVDKYEISVYFLLISFKFLSWKLPFTV